MEVLRLENEHLTVDIAPEVGGRVVRFVDRASGYDYLWKNDRVPLRREEPGSEYDPNFFGGIDELLPNDIPEAIDEVDCPDHGELWTLDLTPGLETSSGENLEMRGVLPRFGMEVWKECRLSKRSLVVKTRIANKSAQIQHFLWKLHIALPISPGDRIDCDAQTWTAADPAWSRRSGTGDWTDETVPQIDGTTEFLFLSGLRSGRMGWSNGVRRFEVHFDHGVFRYAWYFASYGGFDGHEVAILEPCTSMPLSVNEAARRGQCSVLDPGQEIFTEYSCEAAQ